MARPGVDRLEARDIVRTKGALRRPRPQNPECVHDGRGIGRVVQPDAVPVLVDERPLEVVLTARSTAGISTPYNGSRAVL